MPGQSPWMDGFFNLLVSRNGTSVAKTTRVDYSTAFTLTLRPDGTVAIDTDAASGVDGQDITPASVTTTGNVTVGGLLLQGGGAFAHGTATTSGTSSAVFDPFALPLADDSIISFSLIVAAIDITSGAMAGTYQGDGVVLSGSFTGGLDGNPGIMSFGLPPAIDLSWSAGFMYATALQPGATIVSTADSGGTATTITVAETLSDDLTGLSVTISGASGTPGLNGAHVATKTGDHTFTVPVVYVAPDTSGPIRLTSPPTITWNILAVSVVAP